MSPLKTLILMKDYCDDVVRTKQLFPLRNIAKSKATLKLMLLLISILVYAITSLYSCPYCHIVFSMYTQYMVKFVPIVSLSLQYNFLPL